MGGRSLLYAADLRRVLLDAVSYRTAINAFQEKYASLPGDMPNATSVWGRADGGLPVSVNCASPSTTASVGDATCNGDGNGFIESLSGYNHELFRSWQHIAAAKMIVGKFAGISTSTVGSNAIVGYNIPAGSITKSGYTIYSGGTITGNTDPIYYDGDYKNMMTFGLERAAGVAIAAAITPQDAYELDVKQDDGKPATGGMRSFKSANMITPNCTTGNTTATAAYNLSLNQSACALIFMDSFARRDPM